MIVTVVCDVLGEENNGTTIAAMNLIRHLQTAGHTVRILCADQNRKGKENFFVVPNLNLGIFNNYVKKIGVTLAKPDKEIIKEAISGADIVHIMLPFGLGVVSARMAKDMGIPITAGFHMQAENFTSYIELNKLKLLNKAVYKVIYKQLYSLVNGIHYPTKFIRDVFEKNINKTTPGYVISNGVNSYVEKRDTERPREWGNHIAILTTGRYAKEKSQDTLLKAVRYSKHKDNILLILAGQGVKEKYYKKLAKKLPVAPIFKFYTRTEIIDVLNACDIYVHTAEVELEGISCLEAIACGKLTIVSDSKLSATKGFAVDDKCIFKKRNPKDLARVIDYWIDNSEEKRQYEEKYLKNSVVFNQNECMKQMEQMMKEVISKANEEKAK